MSASRQSAERLSAEGDASPKAGPGPVEAAATTTGQYPSPLESPVTAPAPLATVITPPSSAAPPAASPPAPSAAPHTDPLETHHASDGHFGATLEPVLHQACDGRLSPVSWFRTDWQRGGALTGQAIYTDDTGAAHNVVVKLPVPPSERQWLVALQAFDHIVPTVHAHGESLNGYDLAWVVMEYLPHGPLGMTWQGKEFDLLIEAAGRFYAAASQFEPAGTLQQRDWRALYEQARRAVRHQSVPEPQRWSKALKKAHKKLKKWIAVWEDRPIEGWCHGDLHLANALTRHAAPAGPALLIDFARTRVGHWLEDGVYFEHLYWARRGRLNGRKLCKQIAHERKRLGLPVDKDWARRAEAKRALLAMTTPAQLRYDGDPHHLAAALEVLEHAVR